MNWLSKCLVAMFLVSALSPWKLRVGFKVVVHPKSDACTSFGCPRKSNGCPIPTLWLYMPVVVQSISHGRPSVIRGFSHETTVLPDDAITS